MAEQKNLGHWSETAAHDGAELLKTRKKIPGFEHGEDGEGLDYKTGIDLLLNLYNGLSLKVQIKSSDRGGRKGRFRPLSKHLNKYPVRYILFFSDIMVDELKAWERQSVFRDLFGRHTPESIHIENVHVSETRSLFGLAHERLLEMPKYQEFVEEVASALSRLIDIACANALRYEQREEEIRRKKDQSDLPKEERK